MKSEYKFKAILKFLKEHPNVKYSASGISGNFKNISVQEVSVMLNRHELPVNVLIIENEKNKNRDYVWRDLNV